MSTRERWIVYPLLFLTLGITMRLAMRDQATPSARLQIQELVAGQIRCNQLQAVEEIAARQIGCNQLQAERLGCKQQSAGEIVAQSIQCRQFAIGGPNGRPTVVIGTDKTTKGGAIETFSATGAPLVILKPTESGGEVKAFKMKGDEPPSEKPNAQSAPAPKPPSKAPEETPPKANH